MHVYMPGEGFLADAQRAGRSGLTLSAHAPSLVGRGKSFLTDYSFSVFLAMNPSSWIKMCRADDSFSTRGNRSLHSFLRFKDKLSRQLLICATLSATCPPSLHLSASALSFPCLPLCLSRDAHVPLSHLPSLHSQVARPPASILCSSSFLALVKMTSFLLPQESLCQKYMQAALRSMHDQF